MGNLETCCTPSEDMELPLFDADTEEETKNGNIVAFTYEQRCHVDFKNFFKRYFVEDYEK